MSENAEVTRRIPSKVNPVGAGGPSRRPTRGRGWTNGKPRRASPRYRLRVCRSARPPHNNHGVSSRVASCPVLLLTRRGFASLQPPATPTVGYSHPSFPSLATGVQLSPAIRKIVDDGEHSVMGHSDVFKGSAVNGAVGHDR